MLFNEDETTQEVVAKRLGFTSYASFLAFPSPKAILDGRGALLLPDHMSYQGPLGNACIDEIERGWNISQNRDDVQRQVARLYKYIETNFQYEYAVAFNHLLRANLDRLLLIDDEMNEIISKYGGFVNNK